MGLSKVINQNDLSNFSMFVAEMGADKFNDINKLCKLVKPDYGIITAIDIQHLETFGNIENILKHNDNFVLIIFSIFPKVSRC